MSQRDSNTNPFAPESRSSPLRVGVSPHTHIPPQQKKILQEFLDYFFERRIHAVVESVEIQQVLLNEIVNLEIDRLRKMYRYPADAFLDSGKEDYGR